MWSRWLLERGGFWEAEVVPLSISMGVANGDPNFCPQCQCQSDEPLNACRDRWPVNHTRAWQTFVSLVRRGVRGRDYLLHGTMFPKQIRDEDRLCFPSFGSMSISLTRSPEVAVHFATLEQDRHEQHGAVLILDRQLLRTCFRVEVFADHDSNPAARPGRGEFEERIRFRDIVGLSRYLIAVIWQPCIDFLPKHAPMTSGVRL